LGASQGILCSAFLKIFCFLAFLSFCRAETSITFLFWRLLNRSARMLPCGARRRRPQVILEGRTKSSSNAENFCLPRRLVLPARALISSSRFFFASSPFSCSKWTSSSMALSLKPTSELSIHSRKECERIFSDARKLRIRRRKRSKNLTPLKRPARHVAYPILG